MKQNPFKVGDRIRVYGGKQTLDVTIVHIDRDYVWPCLESHGAHWKQCRRLVKKPRKTIWVNEYGDSAKLWSSFDDEGSARRVAAVSAIRVAVPYREVREKK